MRVVGIFSFSLAFCLIGCSASFEDRNAYQGEFNRVAMVTGATPGMTQAETAEAIDRAYLDGVLTAEQAKKAHMQLDVKGHQTAEEIAVINRNRLSKRDQYETRKEGLDVMRDTTQTGSSMISDLNSIRGTLESLFD
jgi:hypothetical protein